MKKRVRTDSQVTELQGRAYAGGVTSAAKLAGPNTTVFEHMRALPKLLRKLGSAFG